MLESHKNKKETSTAGINMNKGEDARKSHLNFMHGKGEYSTNYDSSFNQVKPKTGNVQGLQNLKKDLTANHFALGYQQLDTFNTESRSQFQKRSNPDYLGIVKGSRESMFKLSYDKNNDYSTSNQNEF